MVYSSNDLAQSGLRRIDTIRKKKDSFRARGKTITSTALDAVIENTANAAANVVDDLSECSSCSGHSEKSSKFSITKWIDKQKKPEDSPTKTSKDDEKEESV